MRLRLLFSILAACAALAGPAQAAGGGGGGGSSGGVPSGPDPNKAYQDGLEALQAADYRKAERSFKVVLGAVPKNAEANYYMGMAKAGAGKHDDAVKYLRKAVKYDETLYAAYDQLGRSQLALGETDEARKTLDELAVRLAACGAACPPALQAAHDGLKAAIDGPAPAAAPAPTSLLFGPAPEPRAAYMDAVALINAGRFEEALERLRALGAAIGPNADVLNYMGFASRKLGRFDAALGYYEQALALDPDHRGAHEYLGELYVERRQLDRARAQLAELERLCPYGCAEYEDLKDRIEAVVVGAR
jgi:tetratricopeptide (TPR) repeat protein